MIASIRARAFVGDARSAFSQGQRGQRDQRLFATPPPGGIPGEDDDILIEVLAEIYGLITGPPAWRKSLFNDFKELGFKRPPLTPCVAIMYEYEDVQYSELIMVEKDDLLGAGIGDKFFDAVAALRKKYNFGKLVELMDQSHEYGGKTLIQTSD